jgi:branched-chain amino acid transport system permease protein
VLGLIYAVVAIGFSLVLGVQQVINFSHGLFFAFGAFFFYTLSNIMGYFPAFILAPLIVGGIGLFVERGLVRRVYGGNPLFGLLITFGFALAMEEVIRMVWGMTAKNVSTPAWGAGTVHMGDIIYSKYRLILAAIALAFVLVVWFVISRTNFGAKVKAGMFDSEMVSALGHNLPVLRAIVFTVGAVLAGLAGVIAAPLWSIKSGMGTEILMPAFIITLIGGLGSIKGTLIGGLLVGLSISLGTMVMPRFTDIFPYILLAIVLLWTPRGLFGEMTILEK